MPFASIVGRVGVRKMSNPEYAQNAVARRGTLQPQMPQPAGKPCNTCGMVKQNIDPQTGMCSVCMAMAQKRGAQ